MWYVGLDLKGKDKIGVRVGRVVNKYKVAKHFTLTIEADRLDYRRNPEQVAAEAALDGVYVLRTNVSKTQMAAAQTVRNYKPLCGVV